MAALVLAWHQSLLAVCLKGSYDVAKKNIILYICRNAMCLCGLRFKNTLFSTYCTLFLLLYAPPFWNALIFTKLIVLLSEVCSDWPAIQCVAIGRIPQACDENVTPLTVVWCRDETKAIKPIINEGFFASSGDIITDYNCFYCLFTHRVASCHVNITMSAFVIGETTNNKHYPTLLNTYIWIVSGKFFKYENILTKSFESKASDCPYDIGIAPLYRNSLWAQLVLDRLLSQVQEIVFCKMRCISHYQLFSLNCSGTVL